MLADKLSPLTEKTDSNTKQLKVLFVLPHYNFRDKEYSWVKEKLDDANILSEVASTHLSEAQGRFGHTVKPDVLINYVDGDDYDAYIFVGEEAASSFYDNKDIVRILESAFARRKIVCAIGEAVPIIAHTGRLTGKKVTSTDGQRKPLEDMGVYFTGRIVEQDGDIITANGPYATREFAETIIKALEWANKKDLKGRMYLR